MAAAIDRRKALDGGDGELGHSETIIAFWTAGVAAANGLNPYGVYPHVPQGVVDGRPVAYVKLNPPVSVPVFQLLAGQQPAAIFAAWLAISFGLYLAAVVALRRT